MKRYEVKDEDAVARFTVEYLKRVQENPEKYMPLCTLCNKNRSGILLVHKVEGEDRLALFGVCRECNPNDDIDAETLKRVMEKFKERMKTGESTLHVTPKEWSC